MSAPPALPQNSTFRISDLCRLLETYLAPEQVQEVYRAFLFGAEAHEGQHRLSGEPYITHPIATARILAELRLDHQTVIAALLHDVIEDTSTAKKQIEQIFGREVANLVDGVTKLTRMDFKTQAEAQAENYRKMFLAMAKDIRVILVKLADRLHNMRTLSVVDADKRRRIAHETLEIYVPIATRLGMNALRIELEDLGFAALNPMRHRVLAESVIKTRGNRKEILQKIETGIRRRLRQEQLEGEVMSREKHLYSLYQKMRAKRLSFSEVLDFYAFRIIVDSVDMCYRVLGALHNLYKPIPGAFKDYIAIPKANGYQSLHSALKGPFGVSIEIQIRTRDMHTVSESGIAAHWSYKTGDAPYNGAHARAREWVQELLEMQKDVGNSIEFIENVKVDLFPDEVYVFSPRGDIMELPRGATVVDFAYAVHSDIGNTCVAARIDRRPAPLSSALKNGETIEIVTAHNASPNPAWLDFVVTARARSHIRNFLKNLKQSDAVKLGLRLLDKALAPAETRIGKIKPAQIKALLNETGYENLDQLLEDIGLGNRMPFIVARQLVPDLGITPAQSHSKPGTKNALPIQGTEGMVVNLAKCCHPIPGDGIVGFMSAGRGVIIHTDECHNVLEDRFPAEKWIDVQWDTKPETEFPVEMRVDVANQRGVLATVAAAISEMGSNIENVSLTERDGMTSAIDLVVTVHDRDHLACIMRRLRNIQSVMRISRGRS